ncbi:DUF1971 domain-containing protein [Escherichia coli]
MPQNYTHTRSTPFWNEQTAPAGIFERHLDKGTPGIFHAFPLCMGRSNVWYADEHGAEPDGSSLSKQGQFAVFPPEKWHNIEGREPTILIFQH